ncbi:hypothetical protein P3T36_002885 [Kitasatospora sp. MAP12-15]|uniref:hypothetical protein n=1 Tax=unclassified Kitasatospora TaxID=2633591 RepID=UPI0024756BBD|nr:hypothetical protein [Kitasatospora sp. MAP12-44]MDH6114064.1 hypothetical protein [Kitasatospora sp. MAP12-44]
MSAQRLPAMPCRAVGICFNGGMHTTVDSSRGRQDLEPFWPSRQPHLFDQTCPGSPRASRTARS